MIGSHVYSSLKYRINRRGSTRPHKYGAVRTTVDNITFASKAEAWRYRELKLLRKAGKIECLELQPKFPLMTLLTTGTVYGAVKAHAGEHPVIGHYVADFKYFSNDAPTGWVVEDVKGWDTPLSRWKRKHTEAQYGLTVEIYPKRAAKKAAQKKGKR